MYCKKCGIEQQEGVKYCSGCGSNFHSDNNIKSMKNNEKISIFKILFSLLTPIASLFLLVTFWGVMNLLSETMNGMYSLVDMIGAIIPVLIGLSVLSIPIGVVFAIYFYLNK